MLLVDCHLPTELPKDKQICIVESIDGSVHTATYCGRDSDRGWERGFYWSMPIWIPMAEVAGWLEFEVDDESARP